MKVIEIKHKIEYYKGGKKESLLGILHSELNPILEAILSDNGIKNATIQDYPLKVNEIIEIKRDGVDVYKEKERLHCVSFSGGKDSTALLIRMLELDMKVDRIVFADTQYEFQEMYEYIDKVEKYIQNRFDPNLKIEKVTTTQKLDDWMFGTVESGAHKGKVRGFPLTMFPCYWSRESKIKQLNKIMRGNHRYIGIALDEQRRVSKHAQDMLLHYPLIDWGWTEDDCVKYLEKINLVNPIYTTEINRTGCWWCPKQSIGAWRSLYENYPDKWEIVKQWEIELDAPVNPVRSIPDMEARFKEEKDHKVDVCKVCKKELGSTESAMFEKLYGRFEGQDNSDRYLCRDHVCKHLGIDSSKYNEMAQDFRAGGCDLF